MSRFRFRKSRDMDSKERTVPTKSGRLVTLFFEILGMMSTSGTPHSPTTISAVDRGGAKALGSADVMNQ